jgi:hypothetical protein
VHLKIDQYLVSQQYIMVKHTLITKYRRIATLPFFEIGFAYEVGFGLNVALLPCNRLILSVGRLGQSQIAILLL